MGFSLSFSAGLVVLKVSFRIEFVILRIDLKIEFVTLKIDLELISKMVEEKLGLSSIGEEAHFLKNYRIYC
jgi:hypothetical protein